MSIRTGQRIIRIKSTRAARKYGNWYKDLLGQEFDVLMYSMTEAEYTVKHGEDLKILPDEDIEIISDTK
jgi:hypothetical protein